MKNTVIGKPQTHSLPTVEAVTLEILRQGQGSYLSSLDISRAYKNFNSDPLDYPLLCFKWKNKYYMDQSIPFGSRASASHMQRIAEAIVGMLNKAGIF